MQSSPAATWTPCPAVARLLTGALPAERALALRDPDGGTFADAARRAGLDPHRMGRDDAALARIGAFVELHVDGVDVLVGAESVMSVSQVTSGAGRAADAASSRCGPRM